MEINTFLRRAVLVGLCLMTFVPLIVANQFFFPFITGKNFAFRIMIEIVFALWAILALRDPSARPKPVLLFYAFCAFVVSLGISAILGENPSKSFWSNFERMEGWIGLFHLGLYFVVLSATLRSEKVWKALFNTSIVVSVILGIYGIFQVLGFFQINQGGVRVDGTLGNATYLAVYMLFHVFITTLSYVKWGNNVWLKIWYGTAIVLQILMIFLAATRGTILGLVAGVFLTGLVLVIWGKSAPQLRKYGAILAISIVVLIGVFFLIKNTSFVHNTEALSRLSTIQLSEGQTRFTIWSMAFQGFLERPIFGWGQENFNYVFNKYYDPSLYSQEPWFDRAHNVVLDWLIAGGLVGFLLYVSMYGITLWYLWKPNDTFPLIERALLVGLLAGHAIHNFFVFDNLVSYMYFLVILTYIAYKAHEGNAESKTVGAPLPPEVVTYGPAVVVVVFAFVFYFANVPGMAAASELIDSIRAHPEGVQKNFEVFKNTSAYTGLGRQEIREQLIQFALQVKKSGAGDDAFQKQVSEFAIKELKDEIARAPHDARLYIFLGSYLRQIGDADGAYQALMKALENSPKKQTILLEIGILFHDHGDIQAAQGWMKKAFELEPRFDTARSFYAVTAIETHDKALLESLLMPRYGTLTPDDQYILQAYLTQKDTKAVVGVMQSKVKAAPKDAQAHLQLASALLSAGDRAGSIAEINAAIELQPDFKAQGESFIKDILAGKTPQ